MVNTFLNFWMNCIDLDTRDLHETNGEDFLCQNQRPQKCSLDSSFWQVDSIETRNQCTAHWRNACPVVAKSQTQPYVEYLWTLLALSTSCCNMLNTAYYNAKCTHQKCLISNNTTMTKSDVQHAYISIKFRQTVQVISSHCSTVDFGRNNKL